MGPAICVWERAASRSFTSRHRTFSLGRAIRIREGDEVTLIVSGPLLAEAVQAANLLEQQGRAIWSAQHADDPAARRGCRPACRRG